MNLEPLCRAVIFTLALQFQAAKLECREIESPQHISESLIPTCGGSAFSHPCQPAVEAIADSINVKDFGAIGDGETDDTQAINTAFDHARAKNSSSVIRLAAHIVFPHAVYRITSTLNWTGLSTQGTLVEGEGSLIKCESRGEPCIDALGSRWLTVQNFEIYGSSSSTPKLGMQIGRTAQTTLNSSGSHAFRDLYFTGFYTFASFYNLNSETTSFDHVFFWNSYSGQPESTFSYIADGLNHFGATSSFVKENQPVDKAESFNENTYISCDFRSLGGGTPLWLASTSRHRFVSSYVANTVGPYGAILYSSSAADLNSFLDLDMHFETSKLDHIFLVSGTNTMPQLPGFRYRDHFPFATKSIFKVDKAVRVVSLQGTQIEIGETRRGLKFFDDPSKWISSGWVFTRSEAVWNLPASSFSGIVDEAGRALFTGGVVTTNTKSH